MDISSIKPGQGIVRTQEGTKTVIEVVDLFDVLPADKHHMIPTDRNSKCKWRDGANGPVCGGHCRRKGYFCEEVEAETLAGPMVSWCSCVKSEGPPT